MKVREQKLLYLLLLAVSSSGIAASPVWADEEEMLRRTLQHQQVEREYFVYIPAGAVLGEPIPLLLAIHGYTSTATGFAAHYGLNRHADDHGYMVVYPQGSHFVAEQPDGSSIRITSWNDLRGNRPVTDAGPHCLDEHVAYPRPPECREFGPCAWTSCYDDLGFLRKLLDELEANFPVDPERVYVVGVSNGGMMALRIGCELSGRFAAVVSVIGQLAPGHACGPQSDTPLLHLYGGEDDTVRYDGTPAGDGYIYTSAADTAASWAAALACGNGPARWESAASNHAGLECSAYTDCRRPQDAVVSCMDADGTHEWPGQFVEGVPATCVTAQQKSSMPGQARCEPVTKPATSLGIELVWSFVSDYRTADPR